MQPDDAVIPLGHIAAVILDVDGVVTDTAPVHAAAWKRTLDGFLRGRAKARGERFRPFDLRDDYLRFLAGRAPHAAVRAFLAERGVVLAAGTSPAGAGEGTAAALSARKDRHLLDYVDRFGVAAFPATVALVRRLREVGVRTAAVSHDRNGAAVLATAGVTGLFDVCVDGTAPGLPALGPPHPALLLEAAQRLSVLTPQVAVVAATPALVAAARKGDFGLVVGVDRAAQETELYGSGADTVVSDLGELAVSTAPP